MNLDLVKLVIEALAGQYGVVAQVIGWLAMVVGMLRLVMKPIMTALRAIADATPTAKDNEILDGVEKSKAYSMLQFMIDWIASIKLPEKK